MSEPVRPMPKPMITPEGHWEGRLFLSPESMDTRALFTIPLGPVIPIIVVPGIMGTNLRAKKSPANDNENNHALQPGGAAWRAPNGVKEAVHEWEVWHGRSPADRQRILDGRTLEVDDTGAIDIHGESASGGMTERHGRENWWGEIHWESYGPLIQNLERNLTSIFSMGRSSGQAPRPLPFWQRVIGCEPTKWGVHQIDSLRLEELEKVARYQFPVYACGYNWLESCSAAAGRLQARIHQILEFWKSRRQKCDQVILVTHSMGGLVGRACAKRIPGQIAGVIHGVMPALGAPACYRRIACGTEPSNPSSGVLENIGGHVFSTIAGPTPQATTAVMATSAGALQLLPNHLYPKPWLHIGIEQKQPGSSPATRWYHSLPSSEDKSPYKFYGDFDSWYRLINPAFADPANKYRGVDAVNAAINKALAEAERFHVLELDQYYHPKTFAYFGDDPKHLSFGQIRWVARLGDKPLDFALTTSAVKSGRYLGIAGRNGRAIEVQGTSLVFEPMNQDAPGDGTVPSNSGNGPNGKIRKLFATRGYGHQGSYSDESMLMLTHYLIAKLVQELP